MNKVKPIINEPVVNDSPIYTPESLQQLVHHLWNDRKLPKAESALLYTVLGAFAGLRPQEALDLEWKAVDFAERRIRVVAGDKTERLIPIQANLSEFLSPYVTRRGFVVIHKKVTTILRDYCDVAKVTHIPNGLRRSYTAYRMVETSQEVVEAESGMAPGTLKEKFSKLPSASTAKKYWAVVPLK